MNSSERAGDLPALGLLRLLGGPLLDPLAESGVLPDLLRGHPGGVDTLLVPQSEHVPLVLLAPATFNLHLRLRINFA